MRWPCALLVLCACREPAPVPPRSDSAPSAHEVLQARPRASVAIRGCRGDAGTSDVAIDKIEPDAPVVFVEEIHMHVGTPPNPTIAIWSNGDVVFAGKDHLLTATMPARDATAIAHDVHTFLAHTPGFTSLIDMSGAILLRITVRDGDRWRSSALYADEPERVLAVARGTAKPPVPYDPAARNPLDRSFDNFLDARPWAPIGFARSYLRLVEAIPSAGTPFVAHDYDVTFWTPDRHTRLDQAAVSWPVDLPRVPALTAAECSYNVDDPDDTCTFMLGPASSTAATRFAARLRSGGHRAVTVNDAPFVANFERLYRGERSIDALTACAEQLARASGARLP